MKLEELELGCDAPDESEDEVGDDDGIEVVDCIEENEVDDDYYEDEDETDAQEDLKADEPENVEDSEEYWDEQWEKAMRSSDKMEKLVKTSIEASNVYSKQHMHLEKEMEWKMARANAIITEQEAEVEEESARRRTAKDGNQNDANTGLFLRAAVRPFTYRNLVKEIVLMRHHIIDGEIV